jgi:phage/plasmid-like protein (TIGR03299 family)
MSHELEQLNDGSYSMSYVGEVPWHGLGTAVASNLTPREMLESARLDWTVRKEPAYIRLPFDSEMKETRIKADALVRDSDNSVLDIVTPEWNPLQNEEAFEFFTDFVSKGEMEMHTAGSLKSGRVVWGLARIKESFTVGKVDDEVESHLLFTNPHQFGKAIDIRFTPIRVVCWNTLSMALGKGMTVDQKIVKANHRRPFDAERVKSALGIAHTQLLEYRDAANFLATKRYTPDDANAFLSKIFPKSTKKEIVEPSRNHLLALQALNVMPGHDMSEGSFWQLFNSVTYLTDHVLGREVDTRLDSAWFGPNRKLKSRALNEAVEMAKSASDLEIA